MLSEGTLSHCKRQSVHLPVMLFLHDGRTSLRTPNVR